LGRKSFFLLIRYMKNELLSNPADSTFVDPQLISIIGCISKGNEVEIRAGFQNLSEDLLNTFWILLNDPSNNMILDMGEKAVLARSLLETERRKREYQNRPEANLSSNGSRWVVPPEEYAIVELLTREEGWMSSRRITEAIGGNGRSGRPRRPQWATTRGKNLVARGVLQMNEKGEFRALRNAMDVIEK